ncbi:MAG: hypothetical protein ACI8WT_003802 [Clostridium sp.]|jgi:hypothetical protein
MRRVYRNKYFSDKCMHKKERIMYIREYHKLKIDEKIKSAMLNKNMTLIEVG